MRPSATSILPPGTTIAPRLTFILFGLALLATAAPSKAIDASSKPLDAAGQATIEEVLAKRKTVADQIAALAPKQDANAADADPTDVSAAEDELEFLETLDGIYAQQQARFEQRLELQTDKKKADESLAALRKFGPSEAKPYSFLLSAVDAKMPKLTESAMSALVKDGQIFASRISYRQSYITAVSRGKTGA